MRPRIEMDLCLAIRWEAADGLWIIDCPSLDVATCGDTRDAAKDAIAEALVLWIETCVGRGTQDAALRELGFERGGTPDRPLRRQGFDTVFIGDTKYERAIDYTAARTEAGFEVMSLSQAA